MLGDDRIVRWDGPDTQPCTGAEDCRMIGDGGDDANEDESYVVEYTEMNSERWVIGRDSLHENNERTTQPGTGAENFLDGEKSPEMTIKALLNKKSGVRERVSIIDCGGEHLLGDEHLIGDVKMPGDDMIPKCAEPATQPCTGTDKCDMVHDFEDRRWKGRVSSDVKLTEDGIIGDDRIIGWDEEETQPCTGADNYGMVGDEEYDANGDEMSNFKDEKIKGYDFRETAKMTRAMKRLQAGPKAKKQEEILKKKTGNILTKLVIRIQEMMPEIKIEKAGRRLAKHSQREKDKKTEHSQVEECQRMLDSLCMKEQGPDVSKMLEKLKIKEGVVENEDMSFWEELEILNEEDFLSQEEKESISAAEKDLMEKFRSNEE